MDAAIGDDGVVFPTKVRLDPRGDGFLPARRVVLELQFARRQASLDRLVGLVDPDHGRVDPQHQLVIRARCRCGCHRMTSLALKRRATRVDGRIIAAPTM
jgi:hypothetical protein